MTAKNKKQNNVLCLDGELTVNRAVDLKEILLQALHNHDAVEVDLGEVTKVDLACLQLFCSAHKSALRDGKKWCVRNMTDSILQTAGVEAGFNAKAQCRFHPTENCLWNGGEENG